MPDRRQHDRRENSTLNSKKISISLGNFIMIFIIFILIICSIILFKYFYNKGYEAGDINGYDSGYDDGYSYGYDDGRGYEIDDTMYSDEEISVAVPEDDASVAEDETVSDN